MATDTAASAFDIGNPDAGLAVDTLGVPAPKQQQQQTDFTGPTALDQISMEKAQTAANAQAQALSGTTSTTTTYNAGLSSAATGMSGRILQAAEMYLGTPYAWGGTSSKGVDCSGLVQAAYKAVGINLPRISFEQANSGTRVNLKNLRPGDLVAWDNSSRNPGADHIAIYMGNGEIIEAAAPGTLVRIRKLGSNEGAWGVRMGWS